MTDGERRAFCDKLNAEAIALRDATGIDDVAALHRTARANGLKQVSKDLDEDLTPLPCLIFETCEEDDPTWFNLWVDAPEGTICDGGLGFDDQTGWYEGD